MCKLDKLHEGVYIAREQHPASGFGTVYTVYLLPSEFRVVMLPLTCNAYFAEYNPTPWRCRAWFPVQRTRAEFSSSLRPAESSRVTRLLKCADSQCKSHQQLNTEGTLGFKAIEQITCGFFPVGLRASLTCLLPLRRSGLAGANLPDSFRE